MISSDNVSDIAGLFQGNNAADSSNPVVQKLTEQLAINLGEKIGLRSKNSSGVAVSLITNVLISLINKVKYPNNSSFQISDVVGAISVGNSAAGGRIMDAISKYGGQFGVSDAITTVTKKGGEIGCFFLGKLFEK